MFEKLNVMWRIEMSKAKEKPYLRYAQRVLELSRSRRSVRKVIGMKG